MFKVGQRTFEMQDPSRRDWTNSGPRPLLTELWYPAADDAEEQELLFGGPEPLFRLAPVARDAEWHPRPEKSPLIHPRVDRASMHARVAGMAQQFFARHLEARR